MENVKQCAVLTAATLSVLVSSLSDESFQSVEKPVSLAVTAIEQNKTDELDKLVTQITQKLNINDLDKVMLAKNIGGSRNRGSVSYSKGSGDGFDDWYDYARADAGTYTDGRGREFTVSHNNPIVNKGDSRTRVELVNPRPSYGK